MRKIKLIECESSPILMSLKKEDGGFIGSITTTDDEERATAKRLVACWNACLKFDLPAFLEISESLDNLQTLLKGIRKE